MQKWQYFAGEMYIDRWRKEEIKDKFYFGLSNWVNCDAIY